jgi:hypothetical protein
MLRALIKRTLFGSFVFAFVWVAVIGWWRGTNRLPTPHDVLGWLLALPVGLVACAALARRAVAAARQPALGASPAAARRALDAHAAAPERQLCARVCDVVVSAAPGNHPLTIVAALRDGARAPLDSELVDLAGFPVCAARIANVDAACVERVSTAWTQTAHHPAPRDEALRAVALLEETVLDALERIAAYAPGAHVYLDAIVPPEWDKALCTALSGHLRQRAAALCPRNPLDATIVHDVGASTAFAQIDLAIAALDRAQPQANAAEARTNNWRIVAATHSTISAAAIARGDAAGTIRTSARQQGALAGEAAAAIVLHAPAGERQDPLAIIARPAMSSRSQAVDSAGKTDIHTLDEVAATALAHARTEPGTVGLLIADSGAQGARAVELAMLANARFPALAPLADTLALDAFGATGAAGALVTVALAAHQACDTGKTTLVVSLADARERAALVVMPSNAAAAVDTAPHTTDAMTKTTAKTPKKTAAKAPADATTATTNSTQSTRT